MKKSKIIIPALGVLVLSTAASITGTVAWFTASRTANISTGNFAVVKTDGSLAVSLDYGVGTKVSDSTVNPVDDGQQSPVEIARIGDVSFNPKTKVLYTDNGNGNASGYRIIGSNTSYRTQPGTDGKGTHDWKINEYTYYAFTWTVTLTYTWGADYTDINVFFDYKDEGTSGHSQMTASSQASGNAATKTGFRIAMIGTDHTVVYSGLQTAANLKAVYGTGANEFDEYGDTNVSDTNFGYFGSDAFALGNTTTTTAKASYAQATDASASQRSRADYLGKIQHTAATNSTTITCVAWYEGTDAGIVNENDLAKVQSNLYFYAAINGTN